jgi:signal transduction histidine kinase
MAYPALVEVTEKLDEAHFYDGILNLVQDEAIEGGNLTEAFKRLLEVSSKLTCVERVSIWTVSAEGSAIECQALYKYSEQSISFAPILLEKSNYPNYFNFFMTGKILTAEDANTDSSTREFSEGYLRPLGISSMMDVPIRISGKLEGVICFEHVGQKRVWTKTETVFASIIAELAAKAIASKDRELRIKELLQTSRLATLGETATMLAHEINNPLAIIKGFVQIVLDRLDPKLAENKKNSDYLRKAMTSIDRASRIVRNLKLFARDDDRQKRDIPIDQLIRGTMEMIEQRIQNAGIMLFTADITDDTVNCCELEVLQSLTNILINAVDAIRDSPHQKPWIKLIVKMNPQYCDFIVSNSGPVIPPEVAENMFEPFFTTKGLKGSGLGLKICQQIATDHGGSITYRPVEENTTFVFRIARFYPHEG